MKYIKKKNNNEPQTLVKYRETTPNARYKGFGDKGNLLKKALLKEQGHLCAYCMRRISLKWDARIGKPQTEVEHYKSQKEYPHLDLEYSNMLGVCNGNQLANLKLYEDGEIVENPILHCDKKKLEQLLVQLNPYEERVEKLVTYNSNGKIFSVNNEGKVTQELEEILNLNNRNLMFGRRNAILFAKEEMQRKYPLKTWTKALIQQEIELWSMRNKRGHYRQFCNVAIWFWKQQKQRNRYPEN